MKNPKETVLSSKYMSFVVCRSYARVLHDGNIFKLVDYTMPTLGPKKKTQPTPLWYVTFSEGIVSEAKKSLLVAVNLGKRCTFRNKRGLLLLLLPITNDWPRYKLEINLRRQAMQHSCLLLRGFEHTAAVLEWDLSQLLTWMALVAMLNWGGINRFIHGMRHRFLGLLH